MSLPFFSWGLNPRGRSDPEKASEIWPVNSTNASMFGAGVASGDFQWGKASVQGLGGLGFGSCQVKTEAGHSVAALAGLVSSLDGGTSAPGEGKIIFSPWFARTPDLVIQRSRRLLEIDALWLAREP